MDLRLVSVECDHDDGGDSASGGSSSSGGGARQRVMWPCLYFQSIDDMVTSLVACDVITADDADRSMAEVIAAVGQRYNDDAFHRVIYTESHDEVANGQTRVPSEIAEQ